MSLLSMVSFILPVAVPVENKITPPVVAVVEPLMVQYFTVLLLASLIKRRVEVPAVEAVEVLLMVKPLGLPVPFTRPSINTLSAPLISINGKASAPVMLKPLTVGYT